MSENLENKPQGKGLAVGGFVISLVTIVFAVLVAGIAAASVALGGSAWLIWFWVVLSAASVVMCAMGMSKLGKTGGKKGLAIAGLVIGIVATVWSIVLALGVNAAAELQSQIKTELNSEGLQDLNDAMKELENLENQ
jgi:hypothetical protein